jgi:hypothetical protein
MRMNGEKLSNRRLSIGFGWPGMRRLFYLFGPLYVDKRNTCGHWLMMMVGTDDALDHRNESRTRKVLIVSISSNNGWHPRHKRKATSTLSFWNKSTEPHEKESLETVRRVRVDPLPPPVGRGSGGQFPEAAEETVDWISCFVCLRSHGANESSKADGYIYMHFINAFF